MVVPMCKIKIQSVMMKSRRRRRRVCYNKRRRNRRRSNGGDRLLLKRENLAKARDSTAGFPSTPFRIRGRRRILFR
jgi:hypothetical protein